MTHSYRPGSPILEVTNKINHKKMYLAEGKVHRMIIRNPTLCEFVAFDSPNCIWFKMFNHISDELRITCEKNSEMLEKIDCKQELKEYDYVMAPIKEGIYSRARITFIKTFNRYQFVFVHFIDEGYGKWMLSACLAKMNSKFSSHPWQAFPISLFKLHDEFVCDELVNEKLIRIIDEFDIFKVVPVLEKFENDYFEYTKAEIYGLNSEVDKLHKKGSGESIVHRLAIEMEQFDIINRTIFSAMHQPLKKPIAKILDLKIEQAKIIYREMPEWRRKFFFQYQNIPQMNEIIKSSDCWVKEKHSPQIEPLSLLWLLGHCSIDVPHENGNQQQMIHLDWNSLRSPFELYAFPLRRTTNGSSKINVIRHFYNLHAKLTNKLDQFYGNSANRKPIEANEMVKELLNRKQPFAIYETIDEVSGSNFRRVQIISIRRLQHDCSKEFVRIRYLDIGGSGVVPISGLLRIHSSHCADPPMCIQLMLNKIAPPHQASSWTLEECNYFKSLIRVDIPSICYLSIETRLRNVSYDSAPYLWPGVFAAANLKIGNDNECLEQKMVQEGKAVWS